METSLCPVGGRRRGTLLIEPTWDGNLAAFKNDPVALFASNRTNMGWKQEQTQHPRLAVLNLLIEPTWDGNCSVGYGAIYFDRNF
jgi:hypothetical protein